jgi:hypothetical protein
MSQPPDEPPQEPPADDEWQAPGPPPPSQQYPSYPYPYGQPPQQNPYGGGTSEVYRPIDSGGMPAAVKVVLGVVIGLIGGFFLWIMAAIGFAFVDDSDGSLVLAAIAPLIVPAPLLIWPATRPWAVGLLIGTAISSIGLSSICSSLLNSA